MGLELGADDYVVKPFSERELLARVRRNCAARGCRRSARERRRQAARVPLRGLGVESAHATAERPDGANVELSKGQFSLLAAFCSAPQRVLSRDQLLQMSRLHSGEVFDRNIDVQILRLRRQIEDDPSQPQLILTERGAGYRLTAPVEVLY
jgi:DNA-binding response OmpR family regulator